MASYPLGSYWTVVAFLFFVFTPILPNFFVQAFAGTTVGNFVLIATILVASRVSLGATLSTFLAVAVFYIEYRQRIVANVIRVTPDITKAGVDTDLKNEIAVETEKVAYAAVEDEEKIVYGSENQKKPLETIPGGSSKAAAFFKVNGL
jgi:hypothetical protein